MDMHKNTDIRELVLLCRKHDDDAFDELVRRYTPMMRKLVLGIGQSSCEYDELFAEACVALHNAAQRYDVKREEVTFGLFARICVRNRLLDLVRAFDSEHSATEVDVEELGEEDDLDEQLMDREIFDKLLRSARDLLSDYEYQVLLLHIQGYKTSAIAAMISRSAKSVDNTKSRIFRKLRKEIGDISKL